MWGVFFNCIKKIDLFRLFLSVSRLTGKFEGAFQDIEKALSMFGRTRHEARKCYAAGMSVTNLVKVTMFLSSREYAVANREARQRALGEHAPALTVIMAGIFDEEWLLEIQAFAAA